MFCCNDISYQIFPLLPRPTLYHYSSQIAHHKNIALSRPKIPFCPKYKNCVILYFPRLNKIKDFVSHYYRMNWTTGHNNSFMLPSCFHCLFPVLFSTPPPPPPPPPTQAESLNNVFITNIIIIITIIITATDLAMMSTLKELPPTYFLLKYIQLETQLSNVASFSFFLRQHNSNFSSILIYILLDSIWLDWPRMKML